MATMAMCSYPNFVGRDQAFIDLLGSGRSSGGTFTSTLPLPPGRFSSGDGCFGAIDQAKIQTSAA